MSEKTCAVCDYKLTDQVISVKIGKTVEVCCEDCARALREAQASATEQKAG